ncbi:hypothetical protein HKX48_002473, partial [Thoreauomyces humboldtii]
QSTMFAMFAILSAFLMIASVQADYTEGSVCVQNNTDAAAASHARLDPTGCPKLFADTTITENSVVTFWSGLVNRTAGSDWSWDYWKEDFERHDFAAVVQLTLFVDSKMVPAESVPVDQQCMTDPIFGASGLSNCKASSRITQRAYDARSGFQPFLDAYPNATSVPWAGAVFLSAENANVAVPEGYLKVVSPRPPPWNVTYVANHLDYVTIGRFAVVAGQSNAPPGLVNLVSLLDTVKAKAPTASSSAGSPRAFALTLAVALAALSLII